MAPFHDSSAQGSSAEKMHEDCIMRPMVLRRPR